MKVQNVFLMPGRTHFRSQGELRFILSQTKMSTATSPRRIHRGLFDQVRKWQCRCFCQFHVHSDVQGCCSRKCSVTPFTQGSNEAHCECVQSLLHWPQADDGQKGLTGPRGFGRTRIHESRTATRHCSFQTSTKATNQATTKLQQQGQQLITRTRLQIKLQ